MINLAINDTPWHLFGPRVRKYLVIIMANSQKPFYFTCGNLINIDLRLFVMVGGYKNENNTNVDPYFILYFTAGRQDVLLFLHAVEEYSTLITVVPKRALYMKKRVMGNIIWATKNVDHIVDWLLIISVTLTGPRT